MDMSTTGGSPEGQQHFPYMIVMYRLDKMIVTIALINHEFIHMLSFYFSSLYQSTTHLGSFCFD